MKEGKFCVVKKKKKKNRRSKKAYKCKKERVCFFYIRVNFFAAFSSFFVSPLTSCFSILLSRLVILTLKLFSPSDRTVSLAIFLLAFPSHRSFPHSLTLYSSTFRSSFPPLSSILKFSQLFFISFFTLLSSRLILIKFSRFLIKNLLTLDWLSKINIHSGICLWET